MSRIQAILFDNKIWNDKDSRKWLKAHGFEPIKIHHTKNRIRYRLVPPNLFGYFRTMKKISDDPNDQGVEFIFGYS